MRTMHLFAGAGGGLLADLILGHTPIVAVEWDKYCCSILRERAAEGWFPDLQVYEGDIRMFDPSEYKGRVDCIHAGFPCQPHSVAGKRKGEADERNLWPDTARIIGDIRPQFIMLENVPGIVSTGFVWNVVGDLAEMGYDARWGIISAAEVGAPHRRERWWCFAKRTDTDVGGRDKTLTVRKRREQWEEYSSVCARSFTNPDSHGLNREDIHIRQRGQNETASESSGRSADVADTEHRRVQVGRGACDSTETGNEQIGVCCHEPSRSEIETGEVLAHTNGNGPQRRSGGGQP